MAESNLTNSQTTDHATATVRKEEHPQCVTVDLAEEAEADLAGADQDNSHAKNHTNISISAERHKSIGRKACPFRPKRTSISAETKWLGQQKKDVMYNLIELDPIRSLGLIVF